METEVNSEMAYCWAAIKVSEQQYNQDLIKNKVYRRVRILEFIISVALYQTAFYHEQHEEVTTSSRRPFSRGFQ